MFGKPNGMTPARRDDLLALLDAARATYEAERTPANFWKMKALRDEFAALNRRTDYRPLG